MDAKTRIEKLHNVYAVSMATVDSAGDPQVRTICVMHTEGEKLYFLTAHGKDFHRELTSQRKVAILGHTKFNEMIRFNAVPELLGEDEQHEWVDLIFEENAMMNNVYPGETRYILDVFVAQRGTVEYFNLGIHPIDRCTFELGGEQAEPKGFRITNACIGCGTCKQGCPQQCIGEGCPYRIQPEHCLHCGRCFENCPVQAVERLGCS